MLGVAVGAPIGGFLMMVLVVAVWCFCNCRGSAQVGPEKKYGSESPRRTDHFAKAALELSYELPSKAEVNGVPDWDHENVVGVEEQVWHPSSTLICKLIYHSCLERASRTLRGGLM